MSTTHTVTTLNRTFSFYTSGTDGGRIRYCADHADAVVICGSAGPATVRSLRGEGWNGTTLFDRAGYTTRSGAIDPQHWFDEQSAAGADRLLTPGRWIGWGANKLSFEDQISPEVELAAGPATVLLAIERRWLTKRVPPSTRCSRCSVRLTHLLHSCWVTELTLSAIPKQ